MPRAGRKVPEFDLDEFRQLLVRPYRVIYRINHDSIFVMSIMHYRQLLPGDLLIRY